MSRAKPATDAIPPINVTPELIAALQAAGVVVSDGKSKVPEICGTCANWRPRPNAPAFGECMLSQDIRGPMMTPNKSSCTLWKQKGA